MKTKILLLLLAVFTISGSAQTFDWETATLFNLGCTDCAAEQTVNGNYVSFRDTNSSLINLSHVGFGTTGLSVRNSQPQPESFLTFYPSVNIQSLRLFATANNQNWTISQLDNAGNVLNTTTTNVNIASSVVALNWTNVHQIEIKVTAGLNQSFGFDDIVFTPYVAPCTVTIPDANFKTYLVGNTAINTNGDTEIQCSEATAFTGTIIAGNLGITDLTGIEAFINITQLYCQQNSITSLDVSSNTSLVRFNCSDNNPLTSINIFGASSLEFLWCYTSNSLTSLDVSGAPSLKYLYCYDSALTSLDVSGATALKTLSFYNNSITSLDISANTALRNLDCNSNQLTSLDITANTDLQYLTCNNNAITNLDTSVNTSLVELYCNDNALTSLDVIANTALYYLECQNNVLISIDVSANTALFYLECQNNALTSLNLANGNNTVIQTSFFNATNNPNLTCIEVDDVSFSDSVWTNIDAQTSFSTNCTLDVNDYELQNISIYPNPINNILNIQLEEKLEKIEMYSILGTKVLESTNSSVNVSNLSSGMYLLKVYTKDGKVGVKRFMKQ